MIRIIEENCGKEVSLKIHIGGESVIIDAEKIIKVDTDLDNDDFHIYYRKKKLNHHLDVYSSITFASELHSAISKIDFVEVVAKKGDIYEIPV